MTLASFLHSQFIPSPHHYSLCGDHCSFKRHFYPATPSSVSPCQVIGAPSSATSRFASTIPVATRSSSAHLSVLPFHIQLELDSSEHLLQDIHERHLQLLSDDKLSPLQRSLSSHFPFCQSTSPQSLKSHSLQSGRPPRALEQESSLRLHLSCALAPFT